MPDAFVQDNRLLAVETPLGKDTLLLTAFHGWEAVSQLFEFELTMLSQDPAIAPEALVGKNLTWLVHPEGEERTFFNGFVRQFVAAERLDRGWQVYRARVVPWLWFLTRAADSRIFQKKSIKDILQDVFGQFGFSAFDLSRITGDHPAHEYKVQYRETSFNFISRLIEEEGVFYYFSHENGSHVAVFGDGPNAFRREPRPAVPVSTKDEGGAIHAWQRSWEFRSGKWAVSDFEFKTVPLDLEGTSSTILPVATMRDYEVFDYPAGFSDKARGEALAKLRIEQEETAWGIAAGRGAVSGFRAGQTFTLSDAPALAAAADAFALPSVQHHAHDAVHQTADAVRPTYGNAFTALPAAAGFRPPRVTPRPVLQGPQTAIVVTPAGEEVFTDEHGRIKVQFHWDRRGQYDEKSTAFLRVAQGWAGKQFGVQLLPRKGMEVLVEFLEGDPDRPLVTGCLYNGSATPPEGLPAERSRTVLIRTQSTPNGKGFNEISFDDKVGEEEFYLRAERDQDIRVKNDLREWVGNDRHLVVDADRSEKVGGSLHLGVASDRNIGVEGTDSLTAGGDIHAKSGQHIAFKAGMKVVIEGGLSITLKAGGNFIQIDPAGVTVVGNMVNINSGGSADPLTASPQSPQAPDEAKERKPGGALSKPAPKQTPAPVPPPVLVSQAVALSVGASSPQAAALRQAAQDGTPFCAVCEAARAAAPDDQA